MKRERVLTRTSIVAVLVLLGLLGATRSVSAEGRGGTISLGAVSGNTVEVGTTAAADSWNGFNIHVTTRTSPGVALTQISATRSTALPGQWFCPSSVPAAGEYVFACIGLEQQSVSAPASLASFTFAATGNGCIGVRLVSAPGDDLLDTFTMDSATSTVQAVTVSTAPAKILIGAGTAADCPTVANATTPTLAARSASATTATLAPQPATAIAPALRSAIGGRLSIGTPLGKDDTGLLIVPIDTTAATDAYYGFALHLEFDGSLIDAAGSDFTPTFGGSTLDAGGVPGFNAGGGAPDAHSITAEAWKEGGQSTTLAGTLTHIRLKPRPGAAGCSYLHLVTLGAPDGGTGSGPPGTLFVTGSYTYNASDRRPQQNSYGPDAGIDVQTGTACTASAPALPRSGTGDARGGGRPLLAVAAMLCYLAAGAGLVMAGRAARRRR
jgi:hypothetical protein